ncbi:MAG: FeoB-associated Cys-rich membrane protein [Spirochaetaceae bacterium]|jgi:VIT1/CCC1 family predicted Fe2+/Mn2+ transporter|nr:FeoB-associated Cys-rich membrane protein [Spirochaetaceae bacterium]
MPAFISENLSTILVGTVVLGIIALALVKTVKTVRKGGSPCGCGCEKCRRPF